MQVTAKIGTGAHKEPTFHIARQRLALCIDDENLCAGQGTARGVEGPLVVIIDLDQRHRAVLGHAPCRHDLRTQRLARVLDERPGDRRTGA